MVEGLRGLQTWFENEKIDGLMRKENGPLAGNTAKREKHISFGRDGQVVNA